MEFNSSSARGNKKTVKNSKIRTIYVCEVPEIVNNRKLILEHFNSHGTVIKMKYSRQSKSGIIMFKNPEEARLAKKTGNVIKGHMVKVDFTKGNMKEVVYEKNSNCDEMKRETTKEDKRLSSISESVQSTVVGSVKHENVTEQSKSKGDALDHKSMESSVSYVLLDQKTTTSEEKYHILESRDKMLRQRYQNQKRRLEVTPNLLGVCQDMCPEKERYKREIQRQLAQFERQPKKEYEVDHRKAIKMYARSSADQEAPLANELRTSSTLEMTINYILQNIIPLENFENDHKKLADWYNFVWDRTRSVRKDISQQQLCNHQAIKILEICARFHAYCAFRLCCLDKSLFDDNLNDINLINCLQSLEYLYSDLRKENLQQTNESEMCSYRILLNIKGGLSSWNLQNSPASILNSDLVKQALQVHHAMSSNNFVAFFRLVIQLPFLSACLLHRHFFNVRSLALKCITASHTPNKKSDSWISAVTLKRMLGYGVDDLEELMSICLLHGIDFDTATDRVILSPQNFHIPMNVIFQTEKQLMGSKLTVTIAEALNGCPLLNNPSFHYVPETSFNNEGYLIPTIFSTDIETVNCSPVAVSSPITTVTNFEMPVSANIVPELPTVTYSPDPRIVERLRRKKILEKSLEMAQKEDLNGNLLKDPYLNTSKENLPVIECKEFFDKLQDSLLEDIIYQQLSLGRSQLEFSKQFLDCLVQNYIQESIRILSEELSNNISSKLEIHRRLFTERKQKCSSNLKNAVENCQGAGVPSSFSYQEEQSRMNVMNNGNGKLSHFPWPDNNVFGEDPFVNSMSKNTSGNGHSIAFKAGEDETKRQKSIRELMETEKNYMADMVVVKDILEYTPDHHPDKQNLEEALAKPEELCAQVNAGVREKENSDRLEWMQTHVVCDGLDERLIFNSLTNALGPRKFLHHGVLKKTKSGKELIGFLFNDFLLLATPNEPVNMTQFSFDRNRNLKFKIYRKPLFLNEITLDEDGVANEAEFIIGTENKATLMFVCAPGGSEKRLWLKNIKEAKKRYDQVEQQYLQRKRSINEEPQRVSENVENDDDVTRNASLGQDIEDDQGESNEGFWEFMSHEASPTPEIEIVEKKLFILWKNGDFPNPITKPVTVKLERLKQCKLCDLYFPTLDLYSTHVKRHKLPTKIKTKKGKTSGNKRNLNSQSLKVQLIDPKMKEMCLLCPEGFNSVRKMVNHYHSAHKGKNLVKCKFCEKVFLKYKPRNLREHVADQHDTERGKKWRPPVKYVCNVCGINCDGKNNLKSHQMSHKNKRIKCDHCVLEFQNLENLEKHVKKAHHTILKYQCKKCNLKFVLRQQLCIHQNEKHFTSKDSQSTCNFCGKMFYGEENLNVHMRKHTREKLYNCIAYSCDKTYPSASALQVHMNEYHQKPCYPCNICFESFNRKKNLFKHIRTCHSDSASRLSCRHCNYSCIKQETLESHMKFHDPTRKYPCHDCSWRFSFRSNLATHKKLKHK